MHRPAKRQRILLLLMVGLSAVICGIYFNKQLPAPINGDETTSRPDSRIGLFNTREIHSPDRSERLRINEVYGKLPLSFEANQGQMDESVDFMSRGDGYSLLLTPTEAVLSLRGGRVKDLQTASLRMKILGSNPASTPAGLNELQGKSNYLVGNSDSWIQNVAHYERVRYQEVYPGVDLVYYGNQRRLEYDFILSPGADPRGIRISFDGVEKKRLDSDSGDLVLEIAGGEIRQHKPIIYQEVDGVRREIAGSYVIGDEEEIGFHVADYDSSRPLIIDPILTYSTYLGGGGTDEGSDIALDRSGNVYITGGTLSSNFPTKGTNQFSAGGVDAFVTKLDASGSNVIYSTYIGGVGDDFGSGIDVDSDNNAYITGDTTSTNFPTSGPFQGSNRGRQDAFVVKLNASGNGLIYSTYIGGSIGDAGIGIAVDPAGSAIVTGATNSVDFPTINAAQQDNGGRFDVFVVKLNPAGNSLAYSTYVGGDGTDFGIGIAIDSSGSAYITGSTTSLNFPIASPFQSSYNGGVPFGDVFVTKLSSTGAFRYSTYFGGSESDFGSGIAVDAEGNAYIAGGTLSSNFPTVNARQTNYGGGRDFGDAFIFKLNSIGNMPLFSTYVGGSGDDFASGIGLDLAGNIYVTGSTSSNFPIVDPLSNQNAFKGGISDAFVMKLDSSASTVIYSTYLGGGIEDRGTALAVDVVGNAYVTGNTNSTNFPTFTPVQAINNGTDVFVAKITDQNAAPIGDFTLTINPLTQTITAGASTSFNIGLQPLNGFILPVNLSATATPSNPGLTFNFSSNTITPGGNATLTVNTTAATTPGTFTINITGAAGQLARTQTATVTVNAVPTPDFALLFNPSVLNVSRKQSGQITATVSRVGGFTGNVTVTAPDTKAIKVKLTPAVQSTTGTSVSFSFKVKKKAPRGAQQLVFTARDDTGRVRSGTLTLMIQ
jgi:hypothetical protein